MKYYLYKQRTKKVIELLAKKPNMTIRDIAKNLNDYPLNIQSIITSNKEIFESKTNSKNRRTKLYKIKEQTKKEYFILKAKTDKLKIWNINS